MQAYVDMFSKSLNLEFAAAGISVQNQAPAYVATKMSKIRRATLDAPSPKRWVEDAIKHIGYETTSCPYWCALLSCSNPGWHNSQPTIDPAPGCVLDIASCGAHTRITVMPLGVIKF